MWLGLFWRGLADFVGGGVSCGASASTRTCWPWYMATTLHCPTAPLPHYKTTALPLPHYRTLKLPHCRTAALPPCHTATLPHYRTKKLPHFRTTALQNYRTRTLPPCHTIALPHYLLALAHEPAQLEVPYLLGRRARVVEQLQPHAPAHLKMGWGQS